MKILLVLLISMIISRPLFADEAKTLQKEYDKILQEQEKAEAVYWKKKYSLIELKQKAKDEIGELENEYNDLMKNRSGLKEEILNLQSDNKSLAEKEDNFKSRVSEIFSSYAKTLEELTGFVKRNVPFTSENDLLKIIEIQDRIERKESFIKTGGAIIAFMNNKVEDSQRSFMTYGDIITKDKTAEKGKKIRLGYIFNGYVTDSGNSAGIILRTGSITKQAFEWHEELSSSQMDLISDAAEGIKKSREIALLPVDVMQSKAVGKVYATGGSFFKGLLEWYKSGGVVMYAILFTLCYAVFIIIDRIIIFSRNRVRADAGIDLITETLEKKDFAAVLEISGRHEGPLSRILKAVLQDKKLSRDDAYNKLQEAILHEVPVIEKHLTTLNSLATLAPLLGLLGTVTGMISLFDVITVYGTGDPKLLAGGIAEALITTEFGLIVAIPAVLIHRVLLNNAERIISDLERFGLTVLNIGWKTKNK